MTSTSPIRNQTLYPYKSYWDRRTSAFDTVHVKSQSHQQHIKYLHQGEKKYERLAFTLPKVVVAVSVAVVMVDIRGRMHLPTE